MFKLNDRETIALANLMVNSDFLKVLEGLRQAQKRLDSELRRLNLNDTTQIGRTQGASLLLEEFIKKSNEAKQTARKINKGFREPL